MSKPVQCVPKKIDPKTILPRLIYEIRHSADGEQTLSQALRLINQLETPPPLDDAIKREIEIRLGRLLKNILSFEQPNPFSPNGIFVQNFHDEIIKFIQKNNLNHQSVRNHINLIQRQISDRLKRVWPVYNPKTGQWIYNPSNKKVIQDIITYVNNITKSKPTPFPGDCAIPGPDGSVRVVPGPTVPGLATERVIKRQTGGSRSPFGQAGNFKMPPPGGKGILSGCGKAITSCVRGIGRVFKGCAKRAPAIGGGIVAIDIAGSACAGGINSADCQLKMLDFVMPGVGSWVPPPSEQDNSIEKQLLDNAGIEGVIDFMDYQDGKITREQFEAKHGFFPSYTDGELVLWNSRRSQAYDWLNENCNNQQLDDLKKASQYYHIMQNSEPSTDCVDNEDCGEGVSDPGTNNGGGINDPCSDPPPVTISSGPCADDPSCDDCYCVYMPNGDGDTNRDGKVNQTDINKIISGGFFGTNKTGATRADGDFNGDGKVTQADINKLVGSALFNQGDYTSGGDGLIGGKTETTKQFKYKKIPRKPGGCSLGNPDVYEQCGKVPNMEFIGVASPICDDCRNKCYPPYEAPPDIGCGCPNQWYPMGKRLWEASPEDILIEWGTRFGPDNRTIEPVGCWRFETYCCPNPGQEPVPEGYYGPQAVDHDPDAVPDQDGYRGRVCKYYGPHPDTGEQNPDDVIYVTPGPATRCCDGDCVEEYNVLQCEWRNIEDDTRLPRTYRCP